tara:strand:- start:173 stop:1534 length:1362 start_codon:yes stop_codon:yes gene_type:complete
MSAHVNAVNDFLDDNLDIAAILARITLGPQEEVITDIDHLNSRFNANYRCTPTFRWMPGFYKQLNADVIKQSSLNKIRNKVSTIKNKVQQGRWYVDNFLTAVNNIDSKLYHLRRGNIIFQDNSEAVNIALDDYRTTINNTIDDAITLFPSMGIQVKYGSFDASSGTSNGGRNIAPHSCVVLKVEIDAVETTINIGDSHVTIPMGSIKLAISVDIVKNVMNRIRITEHGDNTMRYSRNNHNSGHSSNHNGGRFVSQEPHIKFPYISDRHSWGRESLTVNFDRSSIAQQSYNHVCFGSFNDEIVEAAWKGDIIALFTYLKAWTANFNVGRTTPLNGYDKMYHGIWPEMDNETWRSAGRSTQSDGDNCSYGANTDFSVLDSVETYCDRYECVLRTTCGMYRAAYEPSPLSDMEDEAQIVHEDGGEIADQDGERLNELTEVELLRMYEGVNTINIGS